MIIKVIIGFAIFSMVILFLLFLFPLVKVCGYSMYPILYDGEFKIGRRVFRKTKCKIGEIYVFRPPYDSEEERFVIKRLVHKEGNKLYFLGDNANDSYDSRYYGYVDCSKVVAHIKRNGGVNDGV